MGWKSRPFAQKKRTYNSLGKNNLLPDVTFKSAKIKKAFTKAKRKKGRSYRRQAI